MPTYVVEIAGGLEGLDEYSNLQQAKKQALAEHGKRNFASVYKAKDEDILRIYGMGGWVPHSDRSRLSLPSS